MRSGSSVPASEVVSSLEKHLLVDGFQIVADLQKSEGCHLVDAVTGRRLLDLYGFFGSMPVGFNHPYFSRPDVRREMLEASLTKLANSDVYSTYYATFVETFHRVAGLAPLDRYFFIDGGALAVENALKAAMDWKVRKNLRAGKGERGTEIMHFRHAFHGRSGYTMSITNTDPRKTEYFAKFTWPRISTPMLNFSEPAELREKNAAEREAKASAQILDVLKQRGDEVAAIIIEPIQGEGGDNHFRGEWLRTLRKICDQHELLLIFDEVQCGMGMTGKMWACEHFNVRPDLLAFGKKSQVCGVMAGPRLDEVADNCFRLPSRLNSTWGGNLIDMVRSTHYLRILEEESLVENAAVSGGLLRQELQKLADKFPFITAVRGRGLMIAFDLPDREMREAFYRGLFDRNVLAIRSGEHTIRFRPALDFPARAIEELREGLHAECQRMAEGELVAR